MTIEPCAMCMGALVQARIAKLVFGARDPKGGAAGSCFHLHADACLNHKIEVQEGILENECRALMQAFFQAKR